MDEGFYRAFEDRYRGDRKDILQRLSAYNTFIEPYLKLAQQQPPQAVDIGCGRGEWLELLQEKGFAARGIDLDAGMLTACQELGLNAIQGDGIAYLGQQPANSLAVVSAFHVVEHIPFDAVATLAQHALQALEPGGLLIFETPNPDNLMVAGRDFYLDPTHIRPIPSQLLAFLLEYVGFAHVKVVPLNENDYFHQTDANLSLWDVISGVSPDYAVVAQKGGADALTQALAPVFNADYGVTIATLATRYNERAQYHLNNVLEQTKQMNQQQQLKLQSLNEAHESLRTAHHNLVTHHDSLVANHEALKDDYHGYQSYVEERFMTIFSSANWRLGAPLRFIHLQIRRVREKGLRHCLRRLPYKLGWWRIAQKFNKPPQSASAVTPGAMPDPSKPLHPKDWQQNAIHTEADTTQSPLEQWNRDRE